MTAIFAILTGIGLPAGLIVLAAGIIWKAARHIKKAPAGQHCGALKTYKAALRTNPANTGGLSLLGLIALLGLCLLTAHNALLQYSLGFALPSLPSALSDVLCAFIFFAFLGALLRYTAVPEIRGTAVRLDWIVFWLCFIPLMTGLLVRFGIAGQSAWLLLHLLSGVVLMLASPFVRFSRLQLFFRPHCQNCNA